MGRFLKLKSHLRQNQQKIKNYKKSKIEQMVSINYNFQNFLKSLKLF